MEDVEEEKQCCALLYRFVKDEEIKFGEVVVWSLRWERVRLQIGLIEAYKRGYAR